MSKEDIDFLISIQDLEQPEFDNACLKRENKRLQQENKQLKSILNELEEWLDDYINLIEAPDMWEEAILDVLNEVKNKIQELKT